MTRIIHFLRMLITRFFLPANELDANLQLLSLLLQQILYILTINGINILSLFYTLPDGFTTLLTLITLCLIKYHMKASCITAIGIAVLQILSEHQDYYTNANYFLLGMLYTADFVSVTSFDFSPCSVQSQSRNFNKIYHRIILIANCVLADSISALTLPHIFSFFLFVLLFLLKDRSLVKSEAYREISLRFYLYSACDHFKLFLGNFIFTGSLAASVITLLLSQCLFFVYSYYCRKNNFPELLAKQQYLKLSFQILRYQHSQKYEELQQISIRNLLQHEQGHLNQEKTIGILQLISSKLDRCDGLLQTLLKIEILIDDGHLLTAKGMLERIKKKQRCYYFLNYLLINKADRRLRTQFKQGKTNVTLIYENEYKQFLAFQHLIYKGAMENLKLNTYLCKEGVQLTRVKAICSKIIEYQAQIDKQYTEIQDHFIVSTEYYIIYLINIKNQYSKAVNILNKHIITEKYLFDNKLDEKLYIKFAVGESGMIIERIGFNSKQLLGYDRKDLEGQRMERFVPDFYKSEHERLSMSFIRDKFSQNYLYQKKTAILNNWKTYNEASIILKLNYSIQGQFYYEGGFHIVKNENYDLKAFFYVNEKGHILETSDSLFDLEEDQVALNIDQFFKECVVGMPLTVINTTKYESFHPIVAFKGTETYYFYAKRLTNPQGKRRSPSLKTLVYIKQSKPPKTLQSTRFQQIQRIVKNRQIYFLLFLIFIFLCTLFASEYLLIYSAYVKFNHQNFVVSTGKNLMRYYNESFILGMNMAYIDLRDNFQYTNKIMDLNHADAAISLQSLNERLKQFNLGKYNITNPIITLSKSNFEIVGMLIANSLIYDQFQNDSLVQSLALDSLRQILPVFFMSSFTDYRISIFSLMTSFVQNDIYFQKLSLGLSLANILVFIFIFLRLFNRLGQIEQMALSFRCQAFPQRQKINEILEFMHELTQQDIPLNQFHQGTEETSPKAESESVLMRTEMSFIKDTGRVLNESQIKATNIEQKICEPSQFWFIGTKSYRIILVIAAILLIALLGILLTNYQLNNTSRDIDETISITSIVTLYRSSAFYSRAIINSFNAMVIKNLKNVDRSTQYAKDIKSYNTYLSTFTIPQFPQTQFSQFSEYTKGLNMLYQERICEYTPCDPLYNKSINLNFITVINSLSVNLSRFLSDTSSLNNTAVKKYINSPQISFYVDLLFESQLLIRAYVLDLSIIYLDDYVLFMNNLLDSKLTFTKAMIVVSVLAFLLFLYLFKFVIDEQSLLVSIVKIYG